MFMVCISGFCVCDMSMSVYGGCCVVCEYVICYILFVVCVLWYMCGGVICDVCGVYM